MFSRLTSIEQREGANEGIFMLIESLHLLGKKSRGIANLRQSTNYHQTLVRSHEVDENLFMI
jgi:hypothetical protein